MSKNLHKLVKRGYETYFEIVKNLDDIVIYFEKVYTKYPNKLTNEVLQEHLLNLQLVTFDSIKITKEEQRLAVSNVLEDDEDETFPLPDLMAFNENNCLPQFLHRRFGPLNTEINICNCVFFFTLAISKKRRNTMNKMDFTVSLNREKSKVIHTNKISCKVWYDALLPIQIIEDIAYSIINKIEEIPHIKRKLLIVNNLQKRLLWYLKWYRKLITFSYKRYKGIVYQPFNAIYPSCLYYDANKDTLQYHYPRESYSFRDRTSFNISKKTTIKQFLKHIKIRGTNDI